MLRSVCLFVLAAQTINLLLVAPNTLSAQNTTVPPNKVRISDSSPLNSMKKRPGAISPATFLQNNKSTIPSGTNGGQDDKIPSILTGKKTIQRVVRQEKKQEKKNEIDPTNIPSSPITPRKTAPLSTNSSFQPSNSGFASSNSNPPKSNPTISTPPKSSQFQATQSIKPNGLTQPPRNANTNGLKSRPDSVSGQSVNSAPRIQSSTAKSPTFIPNPSNTVRPANSSPGQGALVQERPSSSPIPVPPRTRNSYPDNTPRVADRSARLGSGQLGSGQREMPVNRAANDPRTSSGPRSTTTPRTAPSTFSVQNASPQLKLTTSGPRSITVNKAGEFVVKLVNVGQVDASDVVVGIEIPSWVEVVAKPQSTGGEASVTSTGKGKAILWKLNYLPRTRDAMISLKLEPNENRAFDLKTEWTTAPVTSESKVMVTQAKLATRISGPAEVQYGQKAVYTITIENTGNGDAEKVQVALSRSLGGDSATVGVIEAGASKQFEVELTAGQAGVLKLEADVKGDAGIKSAIAKEIVVRRAKLIVKAAGPKFKYAGSALTYNITVENQGDAAAKNISAAALLPLNAEYISGLNQISEKDGRKIGWKIPEIPAGSKRDFIVTCLINQAGEARMEIGVRSEDGLTSGGIVNTKVEALADLKLEVVDPRGPQAVGRQVTYELHIKNRGTKAAQNVQVSGEFSDFIDPITGVGSKASIQKGGVIVFAPIPEIKVGESVVVKVIAKASEPGTHTFRAIVQCKGQDIRKVSEGTTKFFGDGTSKKGSATGNAPAEATTPNTNGTPSPNGFQPRN